MSRRLITAIIAFTFFVNGSGVESSSPQARTKEHTLRPMATGVAGVLRMLGKPVLNKTEEQTRGAIVNYYWSGQGLAEGDYLVTTITPGKRKKFTSKNRWAYFSFRWLKSPEKKIDVVFIAERDLNQGLVLNCYRLNNLSIPMATFKYLSKKTRYYRMGKKTGVFRRVDLAALDVFDYFHGRGDIRPVEGRRLRLCVYYQQRKNRKGRFIATTNKGLARNFSPINFMLSPIADQIYDKDKKPQQAYAIIKDEPNYGPYIEIFYEEPDSSKYTVLARYYDFRRLLGKKKGKCMLVDFSQMAFIDYCLGNKNIYGKTVVPPEVYYHPRKVAQRGRVYINYKRKNITIHRLNSLIGRRPVFIRDDDERYGYKFYVYDAEEFKKNKRPELKYTLARSTYSKTLVLIERVKVYQAKELIDRGLYLCAISILEDFLKDYPRDKKAKEYYKKAKRLQPEVSEDLKKPSSIDKEKRFDFYLRLLADSIVGEDNADKKKARAEALAYFKGIESVSAGKIKKVSSRLTELIDFESGLVSQTLINTAILHLFFELPAEEKTLPLASKVCGFINYRGPYKKELESQGVRFFNSILDEELRRQLISEKKGEWKSLLEKVLRKENLLSKDGKVENIEALEAINIGIFEDNGLLGIYNFYIASRFIRDEKPKGLTFSHYILYKLGLVSAGFLEKHKGIPGAELESKGWTETPKRSSHSRIDSDPQGDYPGTESGQMLADPFATETFQGYGLLTEEQKRSWRPRLLIALKQRGLLDENEKIKDLDAFLSMDSKLFTTSKGKDGLNNLYQLCGRVWSEKFSNIPENITLYHIIMKEFNLISFNHCVGYCKEALGRRHIDAAIKILEIIKILYEEEIMTYEEYMNAVDRLENGIAQLGEELSELGQTIVGLISQLCHDWERFLEEDLLRSVKEVNGFLDGIKKRIKVVRKRNAEFRKVLGKGKELGATYKEARSRFLELMRQFLRLRRGLKKANGNGYISKQGLADILKSKRALPKKETLSWEEGPPRGENRSKATVQSKGKTLPEKDAQEDTDPPDFSDDSEDPEDEAGSDRPSYEPKSVKEIRQMVEKMPDIMELVDYEEALCDAEAILEGVNSQDNGELYTMEEIEEALERLLAPGFLEMLELESDKTRWHKAVKGLRELLPAGVIAGDCIRDCPFDFLGEKKNNDAFSSSA